jgi:PBP1b-binding outer membrane lipoprotein LpoB
MCVISPRPGQIVAALFAAALLAGCHSEPATGAKAPPDPDVTLERVKHAQLKERLAALRGKIVVIDFWGEF